VTIRARHIFENPTLTACNVVHVSLVETLCLAIMAADTTLKTISPIEAAIAILWQLLTCFSF
jgi:hypothetical protein